MVPAAFLLVSFLRHESRRRDDLCLVTLRGRAWLRPDLGQGQLHGLEGRVSPVRLVRRELPPPTQHLLAQPPQCSLVLNAQLRQALRHLHEIRRGEVAVHALILQPDHHLGEESGISGSLVAHGGDEERQLWALCLHGPCSELTGQETGEVSGRPFQLQRRAQPEKAGEDFQRVLPIVRDDPDHDTLESIALLLRRLQAHSSESLTSEEDHIRITIYAARASAAMADLCLELLGNLQHIRIPGPLLPCPSCRALGNLIQGLCSPAYVPASVHSFAHYLHDGCGGFCPAHLALHVSKPVRRHLPLAALRHRSRRRRHSRNLGRRLPPLRRRSQRPRGRWGPNSRAAACCLHLLVRVIRGNPLHPRGPGPRQRTRARCSLV
mmetsp:Transcript_69472/g.155803  ORF Transcript_69472/g.155803 Transcript_69472/m.155803 type:complete len:379 (-) Transcript_69472:16-1152(-)